MAQDTNTLAPWAELVPDVGPMTVADLLALPDDSRWQFELVEGRLVRMPGSGLEASRIAGYLLWPLLSFVMPRQLGAVTGADGTYDLTQPGDTAETGLAPDVAFVAAHRLPARTSPEYVKAPHLAPDLVVEVASPSQFQPEMKDKVERYITVGVRLVSVVWPNHQQVDVWRPDTAGAAQLLATLKRGDALDGLDVLPGFTYPIADLFI
jgi:Uma2 family endonuclease